LYKALLICIKEIKREIKREIKNKIKEEVKEEEEEEEFKTLIGGRTLRPL